MSDLFRTTNEQKVKLYEIASKMTKEGLDHDFIAQAVNLASYYEGMFDLMMLWDQEDNEEEKDNIEADIQDEIDEAFEQPRQPVKKPYISSKDLELIGKNVIGFKSHLKSLVDQWGGITKLSKVTGISQPSLSRFFNSHSMPRRTMLYRIAEALSLSEKEIISDWAA